MNNYNQQNMMEWLLMFWSQLVSLQMQPSPFNKRYYATQNCTRNKNTVLFTGQIHKYGCALNAALLQDEKSSGAVIIFRSS